MLRRLGFLSLLGVCAACGGNSDTGLFDSIASGGESDPGGSGGSSSASGGASSGGASSGGASSGGASSGGTSSGGASTGGASTGGASSGGTASGGRASGGAASGGAASGGSGNPSCQQLIDAAYEALDTARACDPQTDIPHCTGFIEDMCGCSVAIEQPESERTRAYQAARAAMLEAGCSIVCLAIACHEPVGGICHENGSC